MGINRSCLNPCNKGHLCPIRFSNQQHEEWNTGNGTSFIQRELVNRLSNKPQASEFTSGRIGLKFSQYFTLDVAKYIKPMKHYEPVTGK